MSEEPSDKVHDEYESGPPMSEAEFQQAEDRLDGMDRPRGMSRADWKLNQRRTVRTAGVFLVVLVVAVVVAGMSSSSSAKPPSCKAQSANCQQTADGFWVPTWYYGGLALAQGTGSKAPSLAGTQPSAEELTQSGATSSEADEAESYASDSAGGSSGSDGSGDSSEGGGDVSGGDDGGGDAGGGGGDGGD